MYSTKLENLKEMDGFLDSAKLPKFKQEVSNLKLSLLKKKRLEPDVFTVEFYQTFKYYSKLLSKYFKKQKQREHLQSPTKPVITLILKTR